MSITWVVITKTPDGLHRSKQFDSIVAATSHFREAIGGHIMNDDAGAKEFQLVEYHYGEGTVIERYEFKGFFAPAPTEKDPNRPFHCPMCQAELDMYEDVEQWSDATIVYKIAGVDVYGSVEWERDREDIDESSMAHRVCCNKCGDFMPLHEWSEAFEGR